MVGSLMFVHISFRLTTYFVNRLLQARRNYKGSHINITADMYRDITWFIQTMQYFNGTATYDHAAVEYSDNLEINTCLMHLGVVWKNTVYTSPILKILKTILI